MGKNKRRKIKQDTQKLGGEYDNLSGEIGNMGDLGENSGQNEEVKRNKDDKGNNQTEKAENTNSVVEKLVEEPNEINDVRENVGESKKNIGNNTKKNKAIEREKSDNRFKDANNELAFFEEFNADENNNINPNGEIPEIIENLKRNNNQISNELDNLVAELENKSKGREIY